MNTVAVVLIIVLAVAIGGLALQLNETKNIMETTEEVLKDTEEELNFTKKALEVTKNKLNSTEERLRTIREELSGTKTRLQITESQLEETKEELIIEESKVKVEDLKEFSTLTDLRGWLAKNTVSENEYIEDIYDCDDFAIDLVRAAREDGYEIFVMGSVDFSGYTYIDVSDANEVLVARDIGGFLDTMGIDTIEGGGYRWHIDGDRLFEIYEPSTLYDVSGFNTLVIYDTAEIMGHAYCIARINSTWYSIEPMDDTVKRIGDEL